MFDTPQGTIDHALERRREARRVEACAITRQRAQLDQRLTVITRQAGLEGDWEAAGCSSHAQWLAQITSSDFRTAKRLTEVGEALSELPALDGLLRSGELTLDQVAAATPFATPATDAEMARIAIGKAPSEIALAARTLVPPTVTEDRALHRRRAFKMAWSNDGRELAVHGRLPLEQGVIVEQAIRGIAKTLRAADKHAGNSVLEWQQYTADALATLASRDTRGSDGDGVKRSPVTVIVHLSEDEPPFIEGSGPIGLEHAEWLACDARRLEIERSGRDLVHSRVTRCASYPQMRAMIKRSKHCQYPGCTLARDFQGHHLVRYPLGKTEIDGMILLCTRHHKLVHQHHIKTTGTGRHPVFTDQAGSAITADRPHAPPGGTGSVAEGTLRPGRARDLAIESGRGRPAC